MENIKMTLTNTGSPLRVLAIGNSFSQDATEYLWDILNSAGIDAVAGDLYNAGCTMERHLGFAESGTEGYTYYKFSHEGRNVRPSTSLRFAADDEDWNIVTIQEASRRSGVAEAYETWLSDMIELAQTVRHGARIFWHMTWAYQSDSPNSHFPEYGRDQAFMYSKIAGCVGKYVAPDPRIGGVIPVGTAVQNARTSFLGDRLTRDGSHLDLHFGRYLAALCWACALTGLSPDVFSFNPAPEDIDERMLAVARESVANALARPFEITVNS